MLLGTLGASLLGNMLTGKGNKKGKGMLRAGCGKKKREINTSSWLWK